MEAQLVERKPVTATINIKLPAEEVDRAYQAVLARLSRQLKVPGFRPGKAPAGVLERRVGAEALGEEVRDLLIEDAYPRAVRELELTPVDAHFHAERPVRGEEFEVVVHAELYPEVELPAISGIELKHELKEVTGEEVAEFMDGLRRDRAILVPVDRPIEAADWVLLGQLPKDDEGEPDESTDDEEEFTSTFPVDLERAGDELREQLIGRTMGETVDVKLTDTAVKDDEGEQVIRTVRVKIADVKGKELPEDDEELATQYGWDSYGELEAAVRKGLESRNEREAFKGLEEQLVEKLMAEATLELPPSLVHRRKRSLLQDLAYDLSQEGITFDAYLKRLEERDAREEFEAELDEAASRGVRRDLVLEQLMEERGTELSNEEFLRAAKNLAEQRSQDLGRMLTELGEEWQENYRFLLRRDKAVRELVTELSGVTPPELDDEENEVAADAALPGDAEE